MKQRSTFDWICTKAEELQKYELHRLKDVIQALIDVKDIIDIKPEVVKYMKVKEQGRGYLEKKMINGYGPYYYLRYWSGGKLHSQYIGKKEKVLAQPIGN